MSGKTKSNIIRDIPLREALHDRKCTQSPKRFDCMGKRMRCFHSQWRGTNFHERGKSKSDREGYTLPFRKVQLNKHEERQTTDPGRGSQRLFCQARRPEAYKRKLLSNYRKASPKSETFTLVMLPSLLMLMSSIFPTLLLPGSSQYAFLNVLIEKAWIFPT